MTSHQFELEGPGNGFCYTHQSFKCSESGTAWDDAKAEARSVNTIFHDLPFDPSCGRYADEMDYLDEYLEPDETRSQYIEREEGTYNSLNGHFLCDDCYIKAGMPTAPGGWKCP